MPLPGGPADKFGNRYELCWTVSQLVRMLHGSAEAIRIEDPGVTKAEFVITSGGRRELHQAKRSHPSGKWSLGFLGSSDAELLQKLFTQLVGNDAKFVFVSTSDARELGELAERARDAESVQEFETYFLTAKEPKTNFERLRNYWNHATTATAYDVLRRIEVRTSDERSLEEKVTWGLAALFLADPASVYAELRRIAEDSIHQTISRDSLIARLAERGFNLRRIAKLDVAPVLVKEVTDRYVTEARKKLIRKSLIPRAVTLTLLSQIEDSAYHMEAVLTGKAGAGKSACALELVEALRKRDIPVLAFRLDRVETVSTTAELGQRLGLEESPTLVLAAAAAERQAVLVLDQLDAVSTTSGRYSELLDTVEELLVEARGVRDGPKLHIVVVCRVFDWENDHRLRRMRAEKHTKAEVGAFSTDELKDILAKESFDTALFQPRQLELLQLPQNLSLFLEANFDPAVALKFNTAKEIFDRYWDAKRRAVNQRSTPLPDQWSEIIELLCDEMTRTQQLFAPREKLDRLAPDYVHQMASEGVLTFDGKRYGFGHESFFDYCFARAFVNKDQPLIEYLIAGEQHLFRRAQVRQVLAYLRDADRQRYIRELDALLTDTRVRSHLKDLALALVTNLADPGDDEWILLEPWLNSEIAVLMSEQANNNKFAALAWQHFFASQSWFRLADERGLISKWLASDNNNLVDRAVNYLRFHQHQFGDRVAELLEPYIGADGEWKNRLRSVVQWANHDNSRPFFELFLRLIDDGTLDDARGPIAVNSSFWSMLYGLAKPRPGWVPEVIASWLKRRLILIQESKGGEGGEVKWRDLFKHDNSGSKDFHEAASQAPEAFVKHVLPLILTISDAALYREDTNPPRRDAVWPTLFHREYGSIDVACLNSLVVALRTMAKDHPCGLRDVIAELQKRDTFIANYLLLNVYAAGPGHFADEAATLISNEPWRFKCGFSDSSYWVAMQMIGSLAGHCSPENRVKLEEAILRYSPEYERTVEGHRVAGRAAFALLSAFPLEHRSKSAQTHYQELERKFKTPPEPPRGIHGGRVGSPITQASAKKMTDEQWLRAIAKYQSEDRSNHWEDLEKGGAQELAGSLREFVRNEPKRFALLSLRFSPGTNPIYLERTLDGLIGAVIPAELKLAVCRKAYAEAREECGAAIATLLGDLEAILPEDAVQMLDWLATEHPDAEKDLRSIEAYDGLAYGGDIHNHGISTTRGRAAEAIRNLVVRDQRYIIRFQSTLDRMVNDRSLSVRSCVASTLLAVAHYDVPLGLEFFKKLAETDEHLLHTPYCERFIYYGLRGHFEELRPFVERMLRFSTPEVNRAGARLACVAALHHENAAILVDEAMSGTASQRRGIADVAASNINSSQWRAWCKPRPFQLFNDEDAEVRSEAASCFRQLEDEPLEEYEDLITVFCESAAYEDDSFSILHVLEQSVGRLPGITCFVCEKFLTRFSDEAKDIGTSRAGDVHMVVQLLFRTYQQHQSDTWAPLCLDLIDRMCLEGIFYVKSGLEEFDR